MHICLICSESRETAYIHAINSAALAWSVTRACSRGDLTECSCDNTIRRKQRKWQWGGCSEVYKKNLNGTKFKINQNNRKTISLIEFFCRMLIMV